MVKSWLEFIQNFKDKFSLFYSSRSYSQSLFNHVKGTFKLIKEILKQVFFINLVNNSIT